MLLVVPAVMLSGEFLPIVLPKQVREQGLCSAFPLSPGKIKSPSSSPSHAPRLSEGHGQRRGSLESRG